LLLLTLQQLAQGKDVNPLI